MTVPRFFFDRCCPVRMAEVVKAFEEDHIVRYYAEDNRFQDDTDDVVWIKTLSQDKLNWVVLSMEGAGHALQKQHSVKRLNIAIRCRTCCYDLQIEPVFLTTFDDFAGAFHRVYLVFNAKFAKRVLHP